MKHTETVFTPCFSAKSPAIDLAFALSATSVSADQTYKLMKDTVERIIDKYGMGSMRYSFIVYSDSASIKGRFSEKYSNPDELKVAIKAFLPESGGSSLVKAMATAKQAFEDSGVRKDATHVLVIITDKSSGASENDLKAAAKPLEDSGIEVIPVAIGNQVNVGELEAITDDNDNVITAEPEENPGDLRDKIMEKVINGKLVECPNIYNDE